MSVYKRESRGTWQALYRDPTTGRRVGKSFRTKREAEAWERDQLAAIGAGEYVSPSSVTVAEAVDAWLADVDRAGKLRTSSVGAYRDDLRRYIAPRLGSVKLSEVTTGMIESKMIGAMAADGLSAKTIRRAMIPLSRSLGRAVRHGQLRANPATGIAWDEVLPERDERPRPTFTEAELVRMLEQAPIETARTFLGLMVGTGLRIGEALALRRRDLGETTVTVAGTTRRDGTIGPPKTARSERVIPVLPEFREHLDAARLLAAGRDLDALVFGDTRGRPQMSRNVQRRWLYPAQDGAGLPRTGWHALRRSYALALHRRGIAPLDARDLLGHSTIQMTADVYQREGSADALLARLERAIESS